MTNNDPTIVRLSDCCWSPTKSSDSRIVVGHPSHLERVNRTCAIVPRNVFMSSVFLLYVFRITVKSVVKGACVRLNG